MKMLIGLLPVALLLLLQRTVVDSATVQLWAMFAALPVALVFIGAYLPERPDRQWFGASLVILALSVVAVCTAAILFRLYGPEYPFRQTLVTVWVGTVVSSMVMRTWVLLVRQARDGNSLGGWLSRRFTR